MEFNVSYLHITNGLRLNWYG